MANLIDTMSYDGLISGLDPKPFVAAGTIRKLGTAATYKRGTILAKSSGSAGDGKLVILGTTAATNETLTAYAILADDTEIGTSTDVSAAVYLAGCFDPDKLEVDTGYTVVEDDKDALRNGGIFLAPKND
jgi:hypothetical protein